MLKRDLWIMDMVHYGTVPVYSHKFLPDQFLYVTETICNLNFEGFSWWWVPAEGDGVHSDNSGETLRREAVEVGR